MKMSKQLNATSNQKAKFKFSVSKPSFLIPFNNNRLMNNRRKSNTPTRDQLSSPNNTNDHSVSLNERKSSNTTSRYIDHSQCEDQTHKNPKKTKDLFNILHRNIPSADKQNHMTTLDHSHLNRSASSNYNTISSSTDINRKSTKRLNISLPTQIQRKIIVNTNNELSKNNNGVKTIYNKTMTMKKKPHRSSSVNDGNSKKNNELGRSIPVREMNSFKTIDKEKVNEKRMLSEMKSASESRLKIISMTDDISPIKSKYALNKNTPSQSLTSSINKNPNSLCPSKDNHYQKLTINQQFKDHNTSPLLRTKGTKKPLKTHSPNNNKQKGEQPKPSSSTKIRPPTDVPIMRLASPILPKHNESSNPCHFMKTKGNPSRRNIHNELSKKGGTYNNNDVNKTNDPSTTTGTSMTSPIGLINPKKIISIDSITKKGFSGKGVLKVNQDNYFIYKNFNEEDDSIFCGVCDGHGIYGHVVSEFLISYLPSMVNTALITKHKSIATQTNLHPILTDSFIRINSKLVYNENIDTTYSGSTCVTIVYTPERITCANVGDSRAVIGKCVNGIWSSHNLSRDHKPNEPDEYERIIKANGRIESYKDGEGNQIGPERVWVQNENIPGLAMSRSFGDEMAQTVGVIAKPEIIDYPLSQHDKFIIIASDGVWEFIESDECVNMIKDFYLQNDSKGALEYISKESAMRWIRKEEVIDDITAIIIFFE